MKKTILSMILAGCGAFSFAQELTIPDTHPRIWWNATTFDQAKTRFEAKPFQPRAKGDFAEIESGGWKWNNEVAVENALYYLFTGDTEAAGTAIAWARYNLNETLETEMDEEGISCDRCRWWLQEIILVYDWCYDELSAEDRDYFLEGISNVVERWNAETRWGTPDEPASNYNQGYMRNSFLWGVASFGEAGNAQAYIDHALDDRWANFEHYFNEENKSGIPTEGTSYGHTLLNYMIVMFETSRNVGRDLFGNDFFRKAVMFTLYHTTPGPTSYPSGDEKYMTFPFGDASAFWDGRDIVQEFSPFMFYAAHCLEGTHLSELIYDWVEKAGVKHDNMLLEYLVDPVAGSGMADQPLDYYPTEDGTMGQAFAKTSWDADASALHFQLVAPELGGHEHQDGLNFSWWRKGSFLTMEVPGRGFGSGYQVPDYSGEELVNVEATLAHNSLLFGGEGQSAVKTKRVEVLRLQSHEDFFYAAVDGTNSYKSHNEGDDRYSNEFVDKVIREYLFIRPMEVLVVFDRMQSNAENTDLRKTFLLHVLGEPVDQGANDFMTTYQDQNIYVKRLLPAEADTRVIHEDTRDYYTDYYRIQAETEAATEEYFLHVIQAKDGDEAKVEIALDEGASDLTVTIAHKTRGFARLLLNKGMESTGGAFAFSPSSVPQSLDLLHDSIHPRELTTADGFRWLNLDGSGGTVLSARNVLSGIASGIAIWPNPASDRVYFQRQVSSYQVFTLEGKLALSGRPAYDYIDVSGLKPGVYLIRMSDGKSSYVRRMVKE